MCGQGTIDQVSAPGSADAGSSIALAKGVSRASMRSQGPQITDVNYKRQQRGGQIIIRGIGFDPQGSNNTVELGGATETPAYSSGTVLVVNVPKEATHGPTVLVVTTGTGRSNDYPFTVADDPHIERVSYDQSGRQIRINGNGFDFRPCYVHFGNIVVAPASANYSCVVAKVPSALQPGTTTRLTVRSGVRRSNEWNFNS
jgi:hypothetical protein